MFDWNDENQVGDTLWGEFGENEDQKVPHPKERNSLFIFGDKRKKRRNENSSAVRSAEQTSGAKNDLPVYHVDNHYSSNAKEEFSSPKLEMDGWPDLPNLSAAFINEYNDANDLDSFTKELINDLSDDPSLNSVGVDDAVQQDGEPELFTNELADKESGIFLDCDWASIGDFDDLDRYFRNNDSTFGHETIGSADRFISPSADVTRSTAQSIPTPDVPLCKDQPSGQVGSSCRIDELSDQGCPLQKEKVDGQERLLMSQKKVETRSQSKLSQNLNSAWDHNTCQKQQIPIQTLLTSVTTVPHTFQSEPASHFGSSSQVMYNEYGYPTCPFPIIPCNHTEGIQKKSIPVSDKIYSGPVKYSNSLEKLSDLSTPVTMTPQEKIVKLRRRQQMQAMLAIQQQQQQHYGRQITGPDDSASQACSQKSPSQDAVTSTTGIEECADKLPSEGKSLFEDQDEPERVSMLIDDKSLEEAIYYQLQDALQMLDIRVRLCIRDSLLRLVRSAVQRQSVSNSSTDKNIRDEDEFIADEETNKQDRSAGLLDSETDTNHIDRIVAHLLFNRPPESCPSPTKISQSPSL